MEPEWEECLSIQLLSCKHDKIKVPMPAKRGYLKFKSIKNTLDLRKGLQLWNFAKLLKAEAWRQRNTQNLTEHPQKSVGDFPHISVSNRSSHLTSFRTISMTFSSLTSNTSKCTTTPQCELRWVENTAFSCNIHFCHWNVCIKKNIARCIKTFFFQSEKVKLF